MTAGAVAKNPASVVVFTPAPTTLSTTSEVVVVPILNRKSWVAGAVVVAEKVTAACPDTATHAPAAVCTSSVTVLPAGPGGGLPPGHTQVSLNQFAGDAW